MESVKYRILWLVVPVLILGLLASGWSSHLVIETAVTENSWEGLRRELKERIHKVEMFHERARNDLLLAMENDLFGEYFALEETRGGNRYAANGELISSAARVALRKRLEHWVVALHERTPIVEACVVDNTGQEHLRVTGREVAPVAEYSSEEGKSPFFAPTLKLNRGEVNVSAPYMSADAREWVFAYTSPVVLADGGKPGFFHYEVPLSYFQRMVSADDDRSAAARSDVAGERHVILNEQGLVILDNQRPVSFKQKGHDDHGGGQAGHQHGGGEEVLGDYLAHGGDIYPESAFKPMVGAMVRGEQGIANFEVQGITYYVVYAPLPLLGWSMAEIHSEQLLLEGATSLAKVKSAILGVSLLILAVTVLVIAWGMNGIVRPLKQLTGVFREISQGCMQVTFPDYGGGDEIGGLIHSSRKMNGMWSQLVTTLHAKVAELTQTSDDLEQVARHLSAHAQAVDSRTSEVQRVLSTVEGNIRVISDASHQASGQMRQVLELTARTSDKIDSLFNIEEQATGNLLVVVSAANQVKSSMEAIRSAIGGVEGQLLQVSAASRQVSSSIDAVQKRCAAATHQSQEAATGIAATIGSMDKLTQSTNAIGGFVQQIDSISEQTNMLAINSFIEAASAGSAGKGFSVVAGEIKQLVAQTVRVTEDILEKADRIHAERQDTTLMLGRMAGSIQNITLANQEIAQAVDEQQVAVRDISASILDITNSANAMSGQVNDATQGIGDIVVNMTQISSGLQNAHDQFGRIAVEIKEMAEKSQATHQQSLAIDRLSQTLAAQSHDIVQIISITQDSSSDLSDLSHGISQRAETMKQVAAELRREISFFACETGEDNNDYQSATV